MDTGQILEYPYWVHMDASNGGCGSSGGPGAGASAGVHLPVLGRAWDCFIILTLTGAFWPSQPESHPYTHIPDSHAALALVTTSLMPPAAEGFQ